jgi:hypothetical protein
MTSSSKPKEQAREPVMGRADILFRFLELVSKNRPSDLDAYLDKLDPDDESRPIVDQIVDRIIAGDQSLYEKYAQARNEAGPRNPYASPDDEPGLRLAFAKFIGSWINLERALRERARDQNRLVHPPMAVFTPRLLEELGLSKEERYELTRLRNLRNMAIHGVGVLDENELKQANGAILQILDRIKVLPRPTRGNPEKA